MFRYVDVYINLWFDYMRLKCHLLDTFANGICLYVDERAPRAAAACLRIVSFSYWIGSDWIDWSSDCSKHKNEKRTREGKKTWSALEGSAHKLSHFNGPFSMCSILILFALPGLGARWALCRIWGSVFDFSTRKITSQKIKNPKHKIEKEKPTTPILIGPKQSNQWIRYTFIFCLLFLFLLENFFIPSAHCKSHCISINKTKRQRLRIREYLK